MNRESVWLIHPNKLFREGLRRILAGTPFEIEAEASGVLEVQALAAGVAPKLVLLDVMGDNEEQALHSLRDLLPTSRMVVLTSGLNSRRLTMALEAGVDGYLMSDLSPEALIQSLNLVLLGEKVFPTHLAELLLSNQAEMTASVMPTTRRGLSGREEQILGCLLNGDSNKRIANRLGITEATVKVHLKTVLRKIGAANRTQAAIWALNNGFETTGLSLASGS